MDYYKMFDGYVLYITVNGVKQYVTGYYKGVYKYSLDYTHARAYSKKTALKHINKWR